MARRSGPPTETHYLPHPPSGGRRLNEADESAFGRFLRTEVFAPEKLPGNLSIATGLALFVGGVAAVRTWGELLVPV